MTLFYSKQSGGFYDDSINKNIPNDSVTISSEYHAELLSKQSEGYEIQANDKGYPVAVELVLTLEEIKSINESKQQQLLNLANEKITMLQRIVKYNRATDDEKQLLEKLELFTIDVAHIDLTDSNASFPEMPC